MTSPFDPKNFAKRFTRERAAPGGGVYTQVDLYAAISAAYDLGRVTPHQWQPIDDWHEDMGYVIMAHLPVQEPHYIGTPLDSGFAEYPENWFTHFIDIRCIPAPPEQS